MRERSLFLIGLSLLLLSVSACASSLPTTAPAVATSSTAGQLAIATARPTDLPLPTTIPATPTPRPTDTPRPTNTPPPPTSTPQPTPYGGGRPQTITIPSIGVQNANVILVGLEPNGAMAAPKGWWDVGWFEYGPLPGLAGNSVMSGHVDSDVDDQAIFRNLKNVKKGDRIIVGMADKSTRTFVVETTEVYIFNQAPLDRIFGTDSVPRLNIITCEGNFSRSSMNYDRRLVVYSKLEVEG